MESLVAFAGGVVVGAVAVILLQAIRRSSPVESPTALRPTGAPSGSIESILADLGASTHSRVTVTGSRSLIRLDHGDEPTVEIDGTTYHRLADVPAASRTLLLDELRVLHDTPDLPAGALAGLETFLGDDAGGQWHVHPSSKADAPKPSGP